MTHRLSANETPISGKQKFMKNALMVAVICGVFLAPSASLAVELYTGGKSEAELNSEMVIRCQYQMGEFGAEGIDVCIKGERAAFAELGDYPDETADIVKRCTRVMYKAGWAMVQLCSDKDIAARSTLSAYSANYPDIVETCTQKVGRYGHHQIMQCVDEQISGQEGTRD